MALLQYAELADLAVFLTADEFDGLTAPGVLPGLIHASYLVRGATKNDLYQVDEDGYAVNERKREAFTLATAQQVAYWIKTNQDLATIGLEDANETPSVASSSINGATVQLDNSTAAGAIRWSRKNLIDASTYYLRNAGLGSKQVTRVYG